MVKLLILANHRPAAYTHNAFSDRAVWGISLGLVKHSLQVCLDCDWGQEREEGLLCGDSRWGEEARRGGLTSRQGAGAGAGEDGLLPGGDWGGERGEVVTRMAGAGAGGVLTSTLGGGAGQVRGDTPPHSTAHCRCRRGSRGTELKIQITF